MGVWVRERETERDTDRERDRDTERETQRERHRETERDRDRDRESFIAHSSSRGQRQGEALTGWMGGLQEEEILASSTHRCKTITTLSSNQIRSKHEE